MAACAVLMEEEEKNAQKKQKRRKYWVNPYLKERDLNSSFSEVSLKVKIDYICSYICIVSSLFFLVGKPVANSFNILWKLSYAGEDVQ